MLALVGTAFVLCAGSLYLATLMPVTQGRMLFPLTGVLAPLLAAGLVETSWWLVFSLRPPNLAFVRAGDAVPKPLLKRAMLWQLRILGLAAFLAPLSVIAVQYNAPETVESPSARARPVFAQYGDVALLAYERTDRRYSAGEDVRIRLYWQVAAQSPSDNSVHLRLVDDLGQTIGSYRTYPGAGKLRTSTWQAGAVYPDEYTIPISQAAYGRYPFDLRVEWTGERGVIPAGDESGQQIEPVSLDIGAVVSLRQQTAARVFNEIPTDDQPVFDDAIRLEGFQVDIERNEIGLHWKADSAPEVNYTVFAHLLDENGEILSQADSPPRLPTRYWRWGEAFTTFHQFPPGSSMLDYQVIVGLYERDLPGYPKAEFVAPVDEEELEDDALPLDETVDEAIEGKEAELEYDEVVAGTGTMMDTWAIDWSSAAEVIALTPTPEPTSEAYSEDG